MSPPISSSAHLQIIQDPKFYSRVLSKETSASDPSFRIYYGVASGSVPFLWESQPGTPKHPMADSSLPPLTPPPSFYNSSKKKQSFIKSQKHHTPLFQSLLPRLRKPNNTIQSSSSSGSHHRRGQSSSTVSSFSSNSRADEEEHQDGRLSPTSTLCFGGDRSRGCCYMLGVKKALLSIVGNGPTHA